MATTTAYPSGTTHGRMPHTAAIQRSSRKWMTSVNTYGVFGSTTRVAAADAHHSSPRRRATDRTADATGAIAARMTLVASHGMAGCARWANTSPTATSTTYTAPSTRAVVSPRKRRNAMPDNVRLRAVDDPVGLVPLLVDEPDEPVPEVARDGEHDEQARPHDAEPHPEEPDHGRIALLERVVRGVGQAEVGVDPDHEAHDHEHGPEGAPEPLGVGPAAAHAQVVDLLL